MTEADFGCRTLIQEKTFLNRRLTYRGIIVDFQVMCLGKVTAYLPRRNVVPDKALERQAKNKWFRYVCGKVMVMNLEERGSWQLMQVEL